MGSRSGRGGSYLFHRSTLWADKSQPDHAVLRKAHQKFKFKPPAGNNSHPSAQTYEPILDWARTRLGAKLQASDSIFGAKLPESDVAAVRAFLETLDNWHLTAVEHLAAACRSVLLACAVVDGRVSVADAIAVARLEESAQIAQWGLVEGGHDVDIADLKVRVAAPSVFLRLLKTAPQQQQQ